MDRKGESEFNLEKGKSIIGLKSMAYKEYLSARTLFNNDFLHQAAILANTCLEKEIKAYLLSTGMEVTKTHNCFKLFDLLYQKYPEVGKQLNSAFLRTLAKVYESRYYEDIHPGYNFVIIRNKFLAELDFTFSVLEPLIRYKVGGDKAERPTNYEADTESLSLELVLNNYLLGGFDKEEFLKDQDLVYEFRILPNNEILEATYVIPYNYEFDRFKYEALKPIGDNKSFDLSHMPIQ